MDPIYKFCYICSKRHISKPSIEWCSECNQAFCAECKECHSFMSTTENHTTIPIDRYDELRTSILSIIDNKCERHKEEYELYCQTHDKLLCLTCIEDHSECKDIKSLNKIAKNIKNSESLNEIRMSVEDMDTNIDKMISEVQTNHSSAKDCRSIILQEICEIREKVNKHLDTLETRLTEELSELETKAENDFKLTLKHLEEKKLQNARKKQQMNDFTKYASDLQTFLGLRHLSSDVTTDEAFLKSLLQNGSLDKIEIAFEFDENIASFSNVISKFGWVQLQKIPGNFCLESQKVKQAQTIEKLNTIEDIVVKFVHSINTTAHSISGCDFLPDGNIVICNFPTLEDDFIGVFDSNGNYLKTIYVEPNYAFGVVALNNQVVVVTSPQSEGSSIISINIHSNEMTLIATEHRCYSITCTDGKFQSISPERGIITFNANNGKILSTIQNKLPYNASLTSFESKLYFSDPTLNTVSCCDTEGNSIWTLKDNTVVKTPSGIAVDGIGNVYVTNKDINNVIVVSADGKQSKRLLSESDGLDKPRAIQYDRKRNRLLVANEERKAFLYDISL